jgi:protein-export membrane protein SecD
MGFFLMAVTPVAVIAEDTESASRVAIVLRADFMALEKSLGRSVPDAEKQDRIAETLAVLKKRLNGLAGENTAVRSEGTERIVVEIVGSPDMQRVRALLQSIGILTFQLVDFDAAPMIREYLKGTGNPAFDETGNIVDPDLQKLIPEGDELLPLSRPHDYWEVLPVKRKVVLSGVEIGQVQVQQDPVTDLPSVVFTLTHEGGDSFYRVTVESMNMHIAMVFNGRIVTWATIVEPIREKVRINSFSVEEARDLALILDSGAFSVPLKIEFEQTMSAAPSE